MAAAGPAAGPGAGSGPAAPVLAVDIGGTKLAAAVVEPGGRVVAYDRVATPNGEGLDADTGNVRGFIEALGYWGLDAEVPLTAAGWRAVLAAQPVAVMLRKSWWYHVRVAYGIKTDGTLHGTSVHICDPDGGRTYWESFHKFARLYRASDGMAGVRVWGA